MDPPDNPQRGYTLSRVAGPHIPAGDHGPRVTFEEAASESYPSALALARAVGSTLLEPSWWPADAEEISYCVARFSSGHAHYKIGSIRRDGVPVGAIGHFAAAGGGSPTDWLDGADASRRSGRSSSTSPAGHESLQAEASAWGRSRGPLSDAGPTATRSARSRARFRHPQSRTPL